MSYQEQSEYPTTTHYDDRAKRDASVIVNQLQMLESALSEVAKSVDVLRDRLAPVLRPVDPSPENPEKMSSVAPLRSTVADTLEGFRVQCVRISQRVAVVLDSLEV
jgi:hypothetical protein